MATIFISYILVVVILLPITGSIFVLLSNKIAWRIGLWFSNITILLSILLWATYNPFTWRKK